MLRILISRVIVCFSRKKLYVFSLQPYLKTFWTIDDMWLTHSAWSGHIYKKILLYCTMFDRCFWAQVQVYTLSNCEIRCDVIAYLRRVTIKRACSIWSHGKTHVLGLLAVNHAIYHMTSHLVSKLDRVYCCHCQYHIRNQSKIA